MEEGALAPDQKKAVAEERTVVFVDQSGFYLLPGMGGITPAGKLYLMVQERAYRGRDVVRFLKHLLSHISGKLLIIWDEAPIHRSQVVG